MGKQEETQMRVIEAPNELFDVPRPAIFLAGGITGCPDWQKTVIDGLSDINFGCLLNPRRANFPIENPNAAREQITWEFVALHKADVFSMWFCNTTSDQPICFYELGRYVALRQVSNQLNHVLVGVEKGFKRSQDVYIQTELVDRGVSQAITSNLDEYIVALRAMIMGFVEQVFE
jgi:hypothetical protein